MSTGNPIGDAVYVYTKQEALLEQARLEKHHRIGKAMNARIASYTSQNFLTIIYFSHYFLLFDHVVHDTTYH